MHDIFFCDTNKQMSTCTRITSSLGASLEALACASKDPSHPQRSLECKLCEVIGNRNRYLSNKFRRKITDCISDLLTIMHHLNASNTETVVQRLKSQLDVMRVHIDTLSNALLQYSYSAKSFAPAEITLGNIAQGDLLSSGQYKNQNYQ